MCQGFDLLSRGVRQTVVLHDERQHQHNHADDVHGGGDDQRNEEQEIKERTWHIASFVHIARGDNGNDRAAPGARAAVKNARSS